MVLQKSEAYDKIWLAVRYGHRKLAGELMKEMKKVNAFGAQNFNVLHESVRLHSSFQHHTTASVTNMVLLTDSFAALDVV